MAATAFTWSGTRAPTPWSPSSQPASGFVCPRYRTRISSPRLARRLPGKLVAPDLVSSHVRGVLLLQHDLHRLVVRLVELVQLQRLRALGDPLIVVDVLADIQEPLAVVGIDREELPAHSGHDLLQ